MKKIAFVFIVMFFVAFALFIGVTMKKNTDYKISIKDKFKQINVSDEVSKDEAVIIAQNFMIDDGFKLEDINFLKPYVAESGLINGCWAVSFDTTFKVRWIHGLKWYTVDIDKKTGQIKSRGFGPS